MNTLAWGLRVGAEFRQRVVEIAAELRTEPSWLMAVMAFETGRTFSPSVKNPSSSATGLIQFMESTAEGLGTSTSELSEMSAVEQLEFVRAYFKPFAGRLDSLSDCYAAVIWPKAVGQDDNYVVFGKGSDAYAHNAALDVDRDNVVTKGECAAFVQALLTEGLRYENAWAIESRPEPATDEEIELSDVPPRVEPQPEPSMPIFAALLPSILSFIPELIKIFGADAKGEVAKRNVAVAGVVTDAIVKATGSVNLQAAVEAMTANPAVAKAARAAVVEEPTVAVLLEISGVGIDKARAANTAFVAGATHWWQLVLNPVLLVTVLVLPLVYIIVWYLVQHMDKVSSDVIAQTIGTIVGLVLGGIMGFWTGQTYTQSTRRKADNEGVQG